jgi:hypothetical protein
MKLLTPVGVVVAEWVVKLGLVDTYVRTEAYE